MAYSRDQKRHAAARRAQFALATALRRIDFMEDVRAELDAMEQSEAKLVSTGDHEVDALLALQAPKLPEAN